jgi:hypothetical protein
VRGRDQSTRRIRLHIPTPKLSLTPSLNHNFLKLRLNLNSSKLFTGSGLVNPSAT